MRIIPYLGRDAMAILEIVVRVSACALRTYDDPAGGCYEIVTP